MSYISILYSIQTASFTSITCEVKYAVVEVTLYLQQQLLPQCKTYIVVIMNTMPVILYHELNANLNEIITAVLLK